MKIAFLVIFLTITVIYSKSLFYSLVNYDDDKYIVKRRDFIQKLSNIPESFKKDAFISEGKGISYYRPLPVISYILNFAAGGKNLFVYHLTNVLLHVLATFLLYVLLIKFDTAPFLALLFSTLFAVHPALSHVATWLPARNESLFTIFFIAAVIKFIDWLKHEKWSDLFTHLVFFLFAFFNKETAIFLPFICLFYLFFFYKKGTKKHALILLLSWLIVIAVWYYLRSQAIKNPEDFNLINRLGEAKNLLALFVYIGKAVFPLSLSSFPLLNNIDIAIGLVTFFTLLALLILSRRRNLGYIVIGSVWFFSMILLTFFSNVEHQQFYLYEFRLYPAFAGLFLIVKEIDWVKNIGSSKYRYYLVLIPLIFAGVTFFYIEQYKNPVTFYTAAITSSPKSSRPYRNFGWIYLNIYNKPKEALAFYKKAQELQPDMPRLHSAMGDAYFTLGIYEKAEKEYLSELKQIATDQITLYSLGVVYYTNKDYPKAEDYWKKVIQLAPDYAPTYINLATMYSQNGDYDKALYYYNFAKKLGTTNKDLDQLLQN